MARRRLSREELQSRVTELEEENHELQDENEDLQDRLEQAADILAPEEEDDDNTGE